MNHRGVCKLTDFGIARDEEGMDLTRTDTSLGTLGYVAPEQRASAKEVDHRADIYSAGATLYKMVVGEASADLFVADRFSELMVDVPEPLRPVIMEATAYRPDERFETAHEFARRLHEVKAQLAPDPSETPQLALRRDDLEPPVTVTSRPVEVRERAPASPPPDVHPEPSLELELPEDPRFAKAKVAAIVFGLAVVGCFLGIVLVRSGVTIVSAHLQASGDQDAYFATIESSEDLLDKLESLGSHRPVLQTRWDDWKAAKTDYERSASAHAFSAEVAENVEKYTHNPGTGQRVLAREVTTKLHEIQQAELVADEAAEAAQTSGCN